MQCRCRNHIFIGLLFKGRRFQVASVKNCFNITLFLNGSKVNIEISKYEYLIKKKKKNSKKLRHDLDEFSPIDVFSD